MYYVPYRGVGIIFGSLTQEATNYFVNDATSRVTVDLMIETPSTLHTHAKTTLYISSGHTDAIPA